MSDPKTALTEEELVELESSRHWAIPSLVAEVRRLRVVQTYLLERLEAKALRSRDEPRWTGISSDALIRTVFGGRHFEEWERPVDPSDMAACYRAVRRLPAHLRPKGEEALADYRKLFEAVGHYSLAEMDAALANEAIKGEIRP